MNRMGDNLVPSGPNRELICSLLSSNTRFVVIGGLAIAWHFPTERVADDIDLLIEPTIENSRHVFEALVRLNCSGFGPESFAKLGLQVPLKKRFYADLLTPESCGPSYVDVEANAVDAQLYGRPARVASIEALLQMKKRAAALSEAQHKHEADIALLERGLGS